MKPYTTLVNGLSKGRSPWRTMLLLAGALTLGGTSHAQEVFNETFTDSASTAGFTVAQSVGTCGWVYNNPGERNITGAGFDSDFAIFDSDHCGNVGASTGELLSPVFDASTASVWTLSFAQSYRYFSGSIATMDVWDGSTWNSVYTLPNSSVGYNNPAVPESFSITAAANGFASAQVRFQYSGNNTYWWALDNIVLIGTNCLPPSDLAVTGITLNGGTISWTDNGSAGYSWAVTTGAVPDGTNEVAEGDGSITTITGLNSSTTYTAWVRADCGDGSYSSWSSGVSFHTVCGIFSIPYSEDFNSVVTPAIPYCMTTETISGNTWRTVSAPSGMTGKSANVSYTNFGSPDMDTWLYTPGLDLTAGNNYKLTYKYFNNGTYHERMSVYYGTSPAEASMTDALADHSSISTSTVQNDTVYLMPTTSGTYYIGFKCYSIADQNQLYLDDIQVAMGPSCLSPVASVWIDPDCANGQYSVHVDLSSLGDAASVDIMSDYTGNPGGQTGITATGEYTVGPFADLSTVNISVVHSDDDSCSLALGPITYDCTDDGKNALSFDGVNDRVDCGSGTSLDITGNAVTLEAWIYPTAWKTNTYQANIVNSEGGNTGYMLRCGDNGKLDFNLGDGAGFHQMISPANTLTLNTWQYVAGTYDGDSLRMYLNGVQIMSLHGVFNIGATGTNMVVGDWSNGTGRNFPGKIDEVRVWNTAVSGANILAHMNTAYCGNETGLVAYYKFDQGIANGPNPTETTLNDLTGYANNGTLTGFALNGTSSNWVNGVTDLGDCVPVACPTPIQLAITAPTTTGFDISWTDTGAPSYEYEVRTSGGPGSGAVGLVASGSSASGTPAVPITGLVADTTYYAYVRAACADGVFSDWSSVASIYTGYCTPAPSSVDGDGITNVAFGGVDNATGAEDDNYGDYSAMVGTVQQSTLATVNITYETGFSYGTKIWVDINNDFDFADAGELVYTGLSTSANPTTLAATFPVGTMPLGQHRMRIGGTDNNPGPSGPCYTGVYGIFEDYTLLVDPAPDCLAPDGLIATVTSATDGMANWEVSATVPAGGYDVYYSTDPTAPDDATVPNYVSVPDTFHVLSGLPPGETVHVWVRSHCGDANLSLWSTLADLISNDDCIGAISCPVNPDQNCGTVTHGMVGGATPSGLPTTCFGTPDDDVWFSFVATGTTQLVSLINGSGSTTDLYHALWSGADCSSLSLVAGSCSDGNSSSYSGLVIGETYYVQVYTYTSTPGQDTQFDVCIGTPPPPPANDDCIGAYPVEVNPYNYDCMTPTAGTVASATNSGVTTTCGGTPDDDVWFSFVATSTEHRISLTNITGSTSDMFMALWTGDCGGLTLFPGSCSDPQTLNITGLTVGTTYYLQVYTWTSTAGQTSVFDVCIGTPPTCFPPENVTLDSFVAPDASISWDDNGAIGFDYEVRTSGAPGSGATGLVQSGNVAASPLSLTGLNDTDVYSVYIRSNCSDVNVSSWSSAVLLYTGYCPATGTSTTWYIDNFVTTGGSTNIDNSGSGLSTGGYGDFSTMAVSTYAGESFDFTADYEGNTFHTRIWVDWNNDFDFDDAGELAYENITTYVSTATGTVTIPAGTPEGSYRMRIRQGEIGTPTSCGSSIYGEAEDYTVTVTPPPSCVHPTDIVTTALTTTTVDFSWTASITAPADGYQWEVRTSGDAGSGSVGLQSSGSTAAGVTNAGATGLTADTDYFIYVRSICGDGDTSTWEGPTDIHTGYCVSTNTSTTYYLTDFSTTGGSTNITNTSSGLSTNGYGDFTSMVLTSYPSGSIDFTAGFATTSTYYFYIWADLNNDLDFDDPGEQLVATTNYVPSPYGGTFIIPAGTPLGTYRMRVRNSELFSVGPCGSANYGETEDYTLVVVEQDQCSGMPDPGATTGPSIVCAGVPFTLAVENNTTDAGITYQWQTSADGIAWADAPGASTEATYTTSQTVDTWYRLQVTCEFGDVATSTPLEITVAPYTECYCASNFTSVTFEYLTNVNYAGIDNTTAGVIGGPVDFTDQIAEVDQGDTHTLSVTIEADASDYVYVFIDWNQNGILDDAGEVYTLANSVSDPGPYTLDIVTPADAVPGNTRMRAMLAWNSNTPNPCANATYGEAEDYTVHVEAPLLDCEGVVDGPAMPGTACIAPPNGYGGVWSAECVCVENVGVGEIAGTTSFAIYPNPASTTLYIATPNDAPVHVKVYDMLGTLVMEKDMVNQLDITEFATGSYTLVVNDAKGGNERHARFMKQ